MSKLRHQILTVKIVKPVDIASHLLQPIQLFVHNNYDFPSHNINLCHNYGFLCRNLTLLTFC